MLSEQKNGVSKRKGKPKRDLAGEAPTAQWASSEACAGGRDSSAKEVISSSP